MVCLLFTVTLYMYAGPWNV